MYQPYFITIFVEKLKCLLQPPRNKINQSQGMDIRSAQMIDLSSIFSVILKKKKNNLCGIKLEDRLTETRTTIFEGVKVEI